MPNPSIKTRIIGVVLLSLIGFAGLLYILIFQELSSDIINEFVPVDMSIYTILAIIVFVLLSVFIISVVLTLILTKSISNVLINRRHNNKHPNVRWFFPINVFANKTGNKYHAQFTSDNSFPEEGERQ